MTVPTPYSVQEKKDSQEKYLDVLDQLSCFQSSLHSLVLLAVDSKDVFAEDVGNIIFIYSERFDTVFSEFEKLLRP